jgi:hypothetical protein
VARREEVLNVLLAQCICESGQAADPENSLQAGGKREIPDVILSLQGLNCAIEGKGEWSAGARDEVSTQAGDRVRNGVAQIAVGVVYPTELRDAPLEETKKQLPMLTLPFRVVTEADEGTWQEGKLDDILAELRRAHEVLAADDVVERSVRILNIGMERLVTIVKGNPASVERAAAILGVHPPDAKKKTVVDGDDDED